MLCEICKNYARDLSDMTDEHAKNCPAKTDNLLADLVAGIERWASDEDGVPDYLSHSFNLAKWLISGNVEAK